MKYIFILFVALITSPSWAEVIIHVSPAGNPTGTLAELNKNPLSAVTLERAMILLKAPELRDANGLPKDAISIRFDAGIYRLNETLKLDKGSSGSAAYPVTIEGPKDGDAIISGGRAVNGFTHVTDPAILARLPEVSRAHVLQTSLPEHGVTDYGIQNRHGWGAENNPTALRVSYNNQPMTLARWPNTGFAKIATVPDGVKGLSFTLQGGNLAAWKNEPELLASGYWFQDWADGTIPVKNIDLTTNKITLATAAPYGIKAGQRIFIQNALSELDQPGEWYLDKSHGMLYFWPPELPGHTNVEVEISMLEKLLVDDNAEYININHLIFQNSRGDAITVKGGNHISIANSTIRNIGNRGAVISGQGNGLSNMLIENIGEGGVVLSGGDRQTLTPANLYVEKSIIRRFDQVSFTYQPGVLLSGVGNRVIGNKISESPHTAILFTGNDHLISENEIYDVCKETGDAGAIYTGRDWTARGTIISKNYLHDIPPNISWGRTKGVYLDDQASGIIVRGNRFDKVDEAVFIGGGRDNLIEGNFFNNGDSPIHLDARGKNWKLAASGMKKDDLQNHLELVPYNKSSYKDRYPHLANILEDEPGMPKYNIARNNKFSGNGKPGIAADAQAGIDVQ